MFKFFKPKMEFTCLIPGVEKIMPIIEARDHRHPWVNKAVNELIQMRKRPDWGTYKTTHTARCPGIFQLQRHGWILRTWQDIVIETNGDGVGFRWSTPIDQKNIEFAKVHQDYVETHTPAQFRNYMENWRKDTLTHVLKINAPWSCVVPKGYYLLEMPVAVADENRFTTVSGVVEREQGTTLLHPQLMWHVMEGKTLIKAGTPIAQYMLVPKDRFELVQKVAGTSDDIQYFSLVNNNRFVKNYAEVKKLFKE